LPLSPPLSSPSKTTWLILGLYWNCGYEGKGKGKGKVDNQTQACERTSGTG
jgi:hypothetical protein